VNKGFCCLQIDVAQLNVVGKIPPRHCVVGQTPIMSESADRTESPRLSHCIETVAVYSRLVLRCLSCVLSCYMSVCRRCVADLVATDYLCGLIIHCGSFFGLTNFLHHTHIDIYTGHCRGLQLSSSTVSSTAVLALSIRWSIDRIGLCGRGERRREREGDRRHSGDSSFDDHQMAR